MEQTKNYGWCLVELEEGGKEGRKYIASTCRAFDCRIDRCLCEQKPIFFPLRFRDGQLITPSTGTEQRKNNDTVVDGLMDVFSFWVFSIAQPSDYRACHSGFQWLTKFKG